MSTPGVRPGSPTAKRSIARHQAADGLDYDPFYYPDEPKEINP